MLKRDWSERSCWHRTC